MKTKEQQAKEYADRIPHYQDRKQHAAEDYLAGWRAADSAWRDDKENMPDLQLVLVLHLGCPMVEIGCLAKHNDVIRYWREIPPVPDSVNLSSLIEEGVNMNHVLTGIRRGDRFKCVKGVYMCRSNEGVEEELTKEIDWEQVRIDASIAALKGFSSNPHEQMIDSPIQELSEWSVNAADALIAELKKGGKDENNKE